MAFCAGKEKTVILAVGGTLGAAPLTGSEYRETISLKRSSINTYKLEEGDPAPGKASLLALPRNWRERRTWQWTRLWVWHRLQALHKRQIKRTGEWISED